MGGVSLWERQDIDYVWAAYWEIDATLQDYSREQAQSVLEYSSGYELQEPIATKAGGFPGVRYDLFVKAGAGEKLPPKSILFLDTPGGFVIFNGYALEPDVEVKDIHDGAISAVQILKVGK